MICQGQLNQVPFERASMPGRTVVQWDKEDYADLGIIKVDLLGLGMITVLKDCLELIPKHYGEPVDLAQLPEDDEVYRALQRADTVGMFRGRAASAQNSRSSRVAYVPGTICNAVCGASRGIAAAVVAGAAIFSQKKGGANCATVL